MTETNEDFFDNNKVKQLIIQFAFRIPARHELTEGEKMALKNALKDLEGPEAEAMFQLFDEPAPGHLFQVVRQLPVEVATITGPSFILSNDSFLFIYPTIITGEPLPGITSRDAKEMNRPISSKWFIAVQNAIRNASCLRTGKIYEVVLGPFSRNDKDRLFERFLSVGSINLYEIGEMAFTFARYVKDGQNKLYNIQTRIQYQQAKLEDDFVLRTRVDINNRKLSDARDPREVEKVWNAADSMIDEHLKSILNIESF